MICLPCPVQKLVGAMDSLAMLAPPQDDALLQDDAPPQDAAIPPSFDSPAAARTVTPEPFPLDKWSFENKAQFDSSIPQFVSTLESLAIADPDGCAKLCLRFLSYILVEYETYFESLFNNPDCPYAQYLSMD